MLSVFRKPTRATSTSLRTILQIHRATIYSKAPKDKIGPLQCAFALCVFSLTLLAPAGWIMHHIPDYRHRSSPSTD